jgi:hypothetical protein
MRNHPKTTHAVLTLGVLVSGYLASRGYDAHALASGLVVNVAWIWSDMI